MTQPPIRFGSRSKLPTEKWRPNRRGDSGLTTLEWLLIVAAVAGLAALAVVLVQRVVGDTSEQIAGGSARKTAAQIAAQDITDLARAESASATAEVGDSDHVGTLNREYKSDCNLLEITYGDVEDLMVIWSDDIEVTAGTTPTAGDVTSDSDWNATPKEFGCWVG